MALCMPSPFEHKSGIFFLNIRVPTDLLTAVRWTRISLPVGDELVTISATTKIFLSLRTKDPTVARKRFTAAHAALVRYFEAVRVGPKPLTHKQLVALAGDAYRHRVTAIEDDPDHGPHVLARRLKMEAEGIAEWRYGDGDGLGETDEAMAQFFAALQRPFGPQLIALETGRDLDTPYAKVTHAQALEDLFGSDADRILAERALVIDKVTRGRLMQEIGVAMDLVGKKVIANADRDYSVDDSRRFPVFVEPRVAPVPEAPISGRKSISAVVSRWASYNADKKAKSTIRRYTPSLTSFARFHKDKDIRLLTDDDVLRWAEHRRDAEGISASTVNRNDLTSIKTILSFAMTSAGGKLLADNVAHGIKLDKPKKTGSIDKVFTDDKVRDILHLARSVEPRRGYPRATASRRWVPFICAYTGARVQEVCWLRKEDVRQRDGIFVVHFPETKEGIRRWVTLHDALIEEGFLNFCRAAPDGPLFTGDKPQKEDASRSAAEQRASELSAWISRQVELEKGVSPSHGWRHTFITTAEDVGIRKRMVNAITGHNRQRDSSDGYYAPKPKTMKLAMDKYPRYAI